MTTLLPESNKIYLADLWFSEKTDGTTSTNPPQNSKSKLHQEVETFEGSPLKNRLCTMMDHPSVQEASLANLSPAMGCSDLNDPLVRNN